MEQASLNLGAVAAAAVLKFFWGWFWYSPAAFLKPWMASIGLTKKDMQSGMGKGMAAFLIGTLLMTWGVAHGIRYARIAGVLPPGILGGAIGGFVTWLTLVLPVQSDSWAAEKKPLRWLLITASGQASGMTLMGSVLGGWS